MKNGTSASDQKGAFDIWEAGKQFMKKDNPQGNQQRTIIVLGDHNSGKSSFVKILKAEGEGEIKPTGALEYTFIRRSAVKKQLVHSYEVAGKNLRGIVQSLINKDNFSNLSFIVVTDLSSPSESIESLTEWLDFIREQTEKFTKTKLSAEEQREFVEKSQLRHSDHEDSDKIRPFAVPVVVIGNKFDLYEKFDTEIRKWVARTLRYICLINGCHLIFSSLMQPQLSAQVRSIFQTLFFGQNPSNLNLSQKDHMKPVFIMAGMDNINSMNLPHPGTMNMLVALKKHIGGFTTTKVEKKQQEFNFSKYKETKIDSMVAEKQRELQKISKDYKTIKSEKAIPGVLDKSSRF